MAYGASPKSDHLRAMREANHAEAEKKRLAAEKKLVAEEPKTKSPKKPKGQAQA
jgi:hypothetical protein